MNNARGLKVFSASATLLAACFGATLANAQTNANADAAYNGWLQAYLVKPGTATYFANSLTDRSEAFMWGQAYMITGVEDAYDQNQAPDRKQLVSDLLARFEVKNHADLSWDSWNDDAAWATIALVRGYRITGNATLLSAATQAWDMAYKRGWDSTYGGGIWENMDNVPAGGKCGLSNWPFIISGALIYESNKDPSYLTKCEQIYAWSRANVFDTTTGRVYEQVGPKGVSGDDNAYNSGLIVNAASSLYKATGNIQYYNDAILAAGHVIGKYPIMTEDHPANGDFGGDQFFRGLSAFARENKLWAKYSPWLQNNATAAWNNRRTDYNVSLNNFTSRTPTSGNLDAMEAEGSVVVQLVDQFDANAVADAGATNSGSSGGNAGAPGAAGGANTASGGAGSGGRGGAASAGSGGAGTGNMLIGAGTSGEASGGASAGTSGGASAAVGGGRVGVAPVAPSAGGSAASDGCACAAVGAASLPGAPGGLALVAVSSLGALRRRRKR